MTAALLLVAASLLGSPACTGNPPPNANVTYVADGRVWALDTKTRHATCLFRASRPGFFRWGPRGDRVLLSRLEVRALGGAPHRRPTRVTTPSASWGRPIGKSIVFVGRGGRALLKTHPGGGGFHDITPVRGARYKRVVYHPSGLALAFVLARKGRESLWISSNTGKDPHQLVHGRFHTGFEAVAFGLVSDTVYFAARHPDRTVHVHSLPLVGAKQVETLWTGQPGEHVYSLVPSGGYVAFTAGRSCASRRTVLATLDDRFEPTFDGPTRAVGWIDDGSVLLVAVGGCGKPLDLYSVNVDTQRTRLLVRGVDAAATRRPEPFPPPPLPSAERPEARTSFA